MCLQASSKSSTVFELNYKQNYLQTQTVLPLVLLYEGTISIYLEDFRMVELSQAYFRIALTLLLSRCNFSCQMTILNGFHIESEAKLTLESNYPTWEAKYERIIRQN